MHNNARKENSLAVTIINKTPPAVPLRYRHYPATEDTEPTLTAGAPQNSSSKDISGGARLHKQDNNAPA